MTRDQARGVAEILLARQVPAMNALGLGWTWSVELDGRVVVDAPAGPQTIYGRGFGLEDDCAFAGALLTGATTRWVPEVGPLPVLG